MNIELIDMLSIHLNRRGIGNTTAMLEGAKNVPSVILAHTPEYARDLGKLCNRKNSNTTCFGVEEALKYGKLVGVNIPILIDHHAIVLIIQDLLHEYYYMKEQLDKCLQLDK